MLPGDGLDVSQVALNHPDLAGIHFTGSTPTFQHLWRTVGANIAKYRSYPRIVGETGGKDFVVAHPSADPDVLRVALLRGAFEFQGQKCSAASRAYVARSVWKKMKDSFLAEVESLTMGDVTDFSNFMGAVIDDRALRQAQEGDRPGEALQEPRGARRRPGRRLGRLLRPADRRREHRPDRPDVLARSTSARSSSCTSSTTGDFEKVVAQMESLRAVRPDRRDHRPGPQRRSPGPARRCASRPATSTSTTSRPARSSASSPSAVRAPPGTNDKAGAPQNLMRWTSPRSIKETFDPPTDYRYPYMDLG